MTVQVRPILDEDVPRVAEFLHQQLNRRVPATAWARALAVPWPVEAPNRGFHLCDDDQVVGAYLAFYSTRTIDGRPERFCNLGAWCVRPDYRAHSVRLLRALLRQDGFHFTDLSPSGNVVALNQRLKFRELDTATALVPNLPWPSLPRRGQRVSSDPKTIETTLSGRAREIYQHHAGTAAARHLVLVRDGRWCYVMFRRDRRRGLPLFASLLYVSDPELFQAMARPLARHLLLRHRVLVTLSELRVAPRPWPSWVLPRHRHKMFRSPHLRPDQIDNLYSELACVAW